MSSITAVFFDLYGTLILTHDHEHAWREWHGRLFQFIESTGGEAAKARSKGAIGEFWQQDYMPHKGFTIFENRIAAFFDRIGLRWREKDIPILANQLCEAWQDRLEVDPEALEVLKSVGTFVRVGLVTNFDHPSHVRTLLERTGLAAYLSDIVVSAEEGVKKPDPAIMHLACDRLGCKPGEAMYVGDSIVDYEAASQAGLEPVIIRRPGQVEIENTRDSGSRFSESDQILWSKAEAGELLIVGGLGEIPDVVRRRF